MTNKEWIKTGEMLKCNLKIKENIKLADELFKQFFCK
jgi:hypothetical protein